VREGETLANSELIDGTAGLALTGRATKNEGGVGRDASRNGVKERRRVGLRGIHVPIIREEVKAPVHEGVGIGDGEWERTNRTNQ
jgi:hypothetical protein